jgi:hypothetical protein
LKQDNIDIDENIDFSSRSIATMIATPNKTSSKKAVDILHRYQNGLIWYSIIFSRSGLQPVPPGNPRYLV